MNFDYEFKKNLKNKILPGPSQDIRLLAISLENGELLLCDEDDSIKKISQRLPQVRG